MNKLHLIVRDQFPDFIREDYPVFVSFVEAYYKWLDEQSVGKIETIADLDTTPDQFVEYFKAQLDTLGIFNSIDSFNPLYLQKIKEIYNSKGSQKALVNILRLTRNAETEIIYPSEYILKASDGKWNQEKFIVIELIYGTIPETAFECFIRYDTADVRLEVSRLENISSTATRIYFKIQYNLNVSENQIVYFYSDNNTIQCAGKISRIPTKISIVNGGKDWQLGQIIVIPGTVSDTVARVSQVTVDGTILTVDILQYGYEHTENQTLIVSPYPNKPLGTTYDVITTQTSTNPPKFLHTLSISDYTDGAIDRVTGISSGIMGSSYFLQNYVEGQYTGTIVFDNLTSEVTSGEIVDTNIDMERWLESRARLRYEYGTLVTEQGRWLNDSGIISNESIRLQDNFYYQQFSYDIKSDANTESYLQLARLLNPVGIKMFTTYNLGQIIEIEPTATTSFPSQRIDFLDIAALADSSFKTVAKRKTDTITTSDLDKQVVTKKRVDSATTSDVDKWTISKRVPEILTTTDSDKWTISKRVPEILTVNELIGKTINKYVVESVEITDIDTQVLSKRTAESLTSTDSDKWTISKRVPEILTTNETIGKTVNKYIIDSATISSSDNSTFEAIQYNTQGYFSENYVQSQLTLTIGA